MMIIRMFIKEIGTRNSRTGAQQYFFQRHTERKVAMLLALIVDRKSLQILVNRVDILLERTCGLRFLANI